MRPLAMLVLALAFPASAFANCGPAADVDPGAPGASLQAASTATLCLINTERARRHRHSLRLNPRLTLAGLRHARDMVRNKYFAHNAPSGQTFVDRLRDANYIHPQPRWTVGENLAWGKFLHSSPREIVRAWMNSPAHRSNILMAGFREIGIAIVAGAPIRALPGAATYDTEFGVIHRS